MYEPALLRSMFVVKGLLARVFQRHGALEVPAPLLMPQIVKTFPRPTSMIDAAGMVVELPFTLTKSFARLVAHAGISDLKRWSVDRVFRGDGGLGDFGCGGQQPKQPIECDFDIVHSTGDGSLEDAECVKVGFEILDLVSRGAASPIVRINHQRIIEATLTKCHVPPAKWSAVLEVLSGASLSTTGTSATKVRNALVSSAGIPVATADALMRFGKAGCGRFKEALDRLEGLFRNPNGGGLDGTFLRGMQYVEKVRRYLEAFGIPSGAIYFDLLFIYMPSHYNAGLIFQLQRRGPASETDGGGQNSSHHRLRHETIAAGGRYDGLIEKFRYPTARARKVGAVGVSFSVAKLVGLMTQYEVPSGSTVYETMVPTIIDVLVFSMGSEQQQQQMLEDKLSIVADLWKVDIKAEYVASQVSHLEPLYKACRSRNISWVIQLREGSSRGAFGLVKIRSLFLAERQRSIIDVEVSRGELVERMRTLLQQTPSLHQSDDEGVHYHSGQADAQGSVGAGSSANPLGSGGSHSNNPYHYHPSQVSISLWSPYGPVGSIGGATAGNTGSSGSAGNSRARNAQRSVIVEKVMRNMSSILSSFSKPIEVIAHDVPREAVRVVSDTLFETEETFRRGKLFPRIICQYNLLAIESCHHLKDLATRLRSHLRGLREKNEGWCGVFLYNYKDNFIDFCSFIINTAGR